MRLLRERRLPRGRHLEEEGWTKRRPTGCHGKERDFGLICETLIRSSGSWEERWHVRAPQHCPMLAVPARDRDRLPLAKTRNCQFKAVSCQRRSSWLQSLTEPLILSPQDRKQDGAPYGSAEAPTVPLRSVPCTRGRRGPSKTSREEYTVEGWAAGAADPGRILNKGCFPPPSRKVDLEVWEGGQEAGSCYFPGRGSGLGCVRQMRPQHTGERVVSVLPNAGLELRNRETVT